MNDAVREHDVERRIRVCQLLGGAAVDFHERISLEALLQRVERFKGRHILNKRNGIVDEDLFTDLTAPPAEPVEPSKVLRIKAFSTIPMSPEEAIEQMELLGHAFYSFMSDDDHCVKIVYRRNAGDYGLLQPEK